MFIDISFNVTSDHYRQNLDDVIRKSKDAGVMPVFVGLDIKSSEDVITLSRKYNTGCYIGVHPLYQKEKNKETRLDYRNVLETLDKKLSHEESQESIVAIGECGLDYFRSDEKEYQNEIFQAHLDLKNPKKLPYFIHCRNAFEDLGKKMEACNIKGVIHSFDGTEGEARRILEYGFYIGLNGCSFRSEESLGIVREIPMEKIVLETDSPYCLIRRNYAISPYLNLVKARYNEPQYIKTVAEALAYVKNIDVSVVEETVYENTLRIFPELERYTEFWSRENI